MRLWHYRLLPYLPRQQLLSQWRECCCIAKSIAEKGTPNHILVNKIMDYPIDHFVEYCCYVCIEMEYRGYRCDFSRLDRYLETMNAVPLKNGEQIFPEWHDDIYLRENLYNLEEKFRAGGIPADEWQRIYDRFKDFTPLWGGKVMIDCFKTIKKVTPKALTSYDLCRVIRDIQYENKKQNIKIKSLQKRVNVLYVTVSVLLALVSGVGIVLALQ